MKYTCDPIYIQNNYNEMQIYQEREGKIIEGFYKVILETFEADNNFVDGEEFM